MRMTETISTRPIAVEKSVRGDEIRSLTSARAGKILPVAYIPLLREDSVRRGNLRLQLKMDETIHPLMNAIHVTAFAHFVPFTAFERFKDLGLDAYNRSYQEVVEPQTGTTIPYHSAVPFKRNDALWRTMGVHWKEDANIDATVAEAYNTIVNFRRQARSKHLPLRSALSTSTLANAFWKNTAMSHIVPDFDAAMMDGEVELQFNTSYLPIKGIGITPPNTTAAQDVNVLDNGRSFEQEANGQTATGQMTYANAIKGDNANLRVRTGPNGIPQLEALLGSAGLRLSLQNIELAKQTAAFAKLREQYSGLDDDHIIDLLMEGIRVPDEALKQPILLDRKTSIFGYSERFASDGDNLDKSVTTGMTEISLNFRTPPMNVQGHIIITVEIVPEQLFERQKDIALVQRGPNTKYPNFMRDFLDPQKVDVVSNDYVDVLHSTPNATFGYAPLNHAWKRSITRIGGKYYRPAADSFIEDRQRFWSIEKLNPQLTSDFYLVPDDLPHTVFADMLADPFEILTVGRAEIVGSTVFGKTLSEDDNHYDAIMSQVDTTRINPGAI